MTHKDIRTAANEAKETVKDAGREVFAAAKTTVADAATQAGATLRDEAEMRAEAGKKMVAEHGARIAEDLRAKANRQGDVTFRGKMLETVADGVAELSNGLHDRSLSSILEQTERFARRNPGAFVAGAALAGFALARFVRASDTRSAAKFPRTDVGSQTKYAADASVGARTTEIPSQFKQSEHMS